MAAPEVINCPSCAKKFKGKPELAGKKIKCPGCGNPIQVPDDNLVNPPAPRGKPPATPAEPKSAETFATIPLATEDDDAAYGVTHVDLSARCPNCANKMESEDAIICLFCGYNTQTRAIGITKKLYEHTLGERLVWLLPGIATLVGILVLFVAQLFYCVYFEEKTRNSWLNFLNAESTRLWGGFIAGGIIWGMGFFAYWRLIVNPTPPFKEIGK